MNTKQTVWDTEVSGQFAVNFACKPHQLIGLKSAIVKLFAERGIELEVSDIWSRAGFDRFVVGRD
jgi:hypothetical protein